jgi:hypothetical protein
MPAAPAIRPIPEEEEQADQPIEQVGGALLIWGAKIIGS